ncbi:MAG: ribonucleoside hydrolase RihC [Clostridia bacterium]|nr:ribonucleoside hydrolase RihC [Clostridia bacterium]
MKNYYVIIDCDPGIDDAMAIMNALNSSSIEVKLLSTVSGNLSIEETMKNALKLTEIFKKDIPVAEGASEPIKRQAVYANKAQGSKGMGGFTFKTPKAKPFFLKSPEAIYYFLKGNPAKNTTIMCLGPMTNIANLLTKYPDAKNMISRIVFMGGSKDEQGVKEPYREFNVAFDPEAMQIVFDSKIPLVMVPMELGHIAYFDPNEQLKIKKANALGAIFYKMFKKYNDFHVGKLGAAVHDSCAALYLSYPEIFRLEPSFLKIKYHKKDDIEYGYVKCDFNSKSQRNAEVCVDMDIEKFKKIIFGNLSNYN